jgi:hypothetical protein
MTKREPFAVARFDDFLWLVDIRGVKVGPAYGVADEADAKELAKKINAVLYKRIKQQNILQKNYKPK